MPRPPDYGIIYNWDGVPHAISEVPQSMEAFLDKVYAPLEDTQVGALFWCVVDHAARWDSDELEVLGDVYDRTYGDAYSYTAVENIRQMLERGEDPQAALIQRGRELGLQVYGSVRLNDNHLDGAQPEDLKTLDHTELTRLRIDHPEWLLGPQTLPWSAAAWDFSVPQVREHKLALIAETCRRYDWDGLEMDWQRHPFHLPQEHAYRLRYALTDLQRAVRQVTEEVAARRGRPFYLAARVAGTLEMSRSIGYDVPAWIEEGLVDMLIPAGGYGMDPAIDVAGYLELCRGTDVVVYPALDVWLSSITEGEHAGLIKFVGPEAAMEKEKMRNRAVASRYHRAGAHGIYIFNWYAGRDSRRELLTQIGARETLRRQDKIYAATHRVVIRQQSWGGAAMYDRIWGEVPVVLRPTLTGAGPKFELEVAEDPLADSAVRVELRVRLEEWVKGDVVRLLWDGVERDKVERRYHIQENQAGNPFDAPISEVSSAVWLCAAMAAEEVAQGRHCVEVALQERHPKLRADMVLTDVELVIAYGRESE